MLNHQAKHINFQLRYFSFRLSHIVLFLTLALLFACSPKFSEKPLPPNSPQRFSLSGNDSLMDQWWQSFQSEQLDRFIQKGLDSNFNLMAAVQRINAAQAMVRSQGSNRYPSLEAGVQSGISVPEPDFVGGELFQLGFRSAYEVDLFGRLKSALDAERYRAQASIYDYRAGGISVSANIANTYFAWQAALNRQKLLKQQEKNNRKVLKSLKSRYGSGQISVADILRQEQLVQNNLQLLLQAETSVAVLENQLNILMGKAPQSPIQGVIEDSLSLPPMPETGIPAELIQRRPDVQASFARLKAADRELASAIANRYPRLSINANFQARANTFAQLFEGWAYSLGANLVGPIFYGGRLRAEKDRAEAVKQQRLYEYYQDVLVAFQEVEDALIREEKQAEAIKLIDQQLVLANRSADQLRRQYFNGSANYIDVLTAINQKQSIELNRINLQQQLLQNRISLYRALAGGIQANANQQQTN